MTNMKEPRTIAEVGAVAAEVKRLFVQEGTLGKTLIRWTDENRTTPVGFATLVLVALGLALPESYLLRRYPAIRSLRGCPLDEQVAHIRHKKPFDLVTGPEGVPWTKRNTTVVRRTYDQLSSAECRQLFAGGDAISQFELFVREVVRTGHSNRKVKMPGDSHAP